jgi:hypothetical protein
VPYPTVASRGARRAPQVRKCDGVAKPQSADRAAFAVTEPRGGGGHAQRMVSMKC